MKMDQIAFYASNDRAADVIKQQFGLQDKTWIVDHVTAESSIYGTSIGVSFPSTPMVSKGTLQFNYDLGIEVEILTYHDSNNWHHLVNRNPSPLFISHVGLHLDDDEDFPEMKHCRLVQETKTISHTSDYLTNPTSPGYGRKYHYKIFALSPGSYIKFIKRIHPASRPEEERKVPRHEQPKTPADFLREAAATYEKRNAVYQSNYLNVGNVMAAIFPDGVTIKSAHDWNRLHILLLGVVKQTRYCNNWSSGGHADSIRDNTVYSAMIECIDANRK